MFFQCLLLRLYVTRCKYFTQTSFFPFFCFFGKSIKQKLKDKIYLSSLYFLSPFASLALADWLLKCCFLSRELQNSARARMMEITFLASLCCASVRPREYFKCNWVGCVHKGKMVCLWPKRCTLFRFWICGQTFNTAIFTSFQIYLKLVGNIKQLVLFYTWVL